MPHVYLDSSALVKWVIAETESDALGNALRERPKRFCSELVLAEVPRAVRRSGRWSEARERTEQIMVRVHLVPLERDILRRAGTIDPLLLRTLDAIHVAAALVLDLDDLEFITYDQRMARAATANGLKVVQPGRQG